jgi:hypothetical protein
MSVVEEEQLVREQGQESVQVKGNLLELEERLLLLEYLVQEY